MASKRGDFFRRHGKIAFYLFAIAVEAAAAAILATRGGTVSKGASVLVAAALVGTGAKGAREVVKELTNSEKTATQLLKFVEKWAPKLLKRLATLLAKKDAHEFEKELWSLHTAVLEQCASLVKGNGVRTALYEMNQDQLCPIPYSTGWDPHSPPTFELSKGRGLSMTEILSESNKVYTSNRDEERDLNVLHFSFDDAYKSLVCVPIRVGNNLKGFLHLEGKSKGAVDASVSAAVENIALIVGSAWAAKP